MLRLKIFEGSIVELSCRVGSLMVCMENLKKVRRGNMKSTGIVRKVDELGRIVLPIELRRTLDIAEKDAIEIYVDGDSIILRKYEPTCIFCGDGRNVENYKGKNICANCMKELRNGK